METSLRPEGPSVRPLLRWLAMEDELKPGGAAVSFLDKMSPDVARLV